MSTHQQVLIIGAGTAGIMAASQLKKQKPSLSIGIMDPADTHYYQPAWTLVGANAYKYKDTARSMKSLIPPFVHVRCAAIFAGKSSPVFFTHQIVFVQLRYAIRKAYLNHHSYI